MKFFNREKEIKEILSIIKTKPKLIHFIYGPTNSGKTALIKEIIENRLDKDRYEIVYINLRGRFIEDYKSFIKVLFSIKKESFKEKLKNFFKGLLFSLPKALSKEAIKKASSGILEGIPVAESLLKKFLKKDKLEDVFVFLESYFEKIKNSGKIPILIIDELQVIGDLKINDFLIYKLFNFFIHLTKEKHLAHVFCLSSDSLFIEKIYNEGKLEGRTKYILVDDFNKENALKFMDFYAKEVLKRNLKEKEKEKIYNLIGGKPIYLMSIIDELLYKNLDETLNYFLQNEKAKLKMLLEFLKKDKEIEIDGEKYKITKEDVIKALSLFKDSYEIKKDLIPLEIYYYLVRKNILFLNPITEILRPQSRLTWYAINKALKELSLI